MIMVCCVILGGLSATDRGVLLGVLSAHGLRPASRRTSSTTSFQEQFDAGAKTYLKGERVGSLIIFGAVLILMMRFRPGGAPCPKERHQRELHPEGERGKEGEAARESGSQGETRRADAPKPTE